MKEGPKQQAEGLAFPSRPGVFKHFTHKIAWGPCQKCRFLFPSPGDCLLVMRP